MIKTRSDEYCDEARQCIPGGVNSPVRAFQSVHDRPFYVKRAKGAYLYDVDGNSFIDYVSSWGAIILGHADDGLDRGRNRCAEGRDKLRGMPSVRDRTCPLDRGCIPVDGLRPPDDIGDRSDHERDKARARIYGKGRHYQVPGMLSRAR